MLKCQFKFFSAQKFGDLPDENEDNFLVPVNSEAEVLKFAISDGATESSFAKQWSDLLVCAYKENSFHREHIIETLKQVSESWHSIVDTIDLPWYAQQKREVGSFATFLGVTIDSKTESFEASGIGDCALFQIRNDALLFTFPILSLEEFGNTPNLIASNPSYRIDIEKKISYCKQDIQAGDIILLASDAIAFWIFKQIAEGEKPWDHLANVLNFEHNNAELQNWLNQKRETSEIKNDDVTILILNFE
jgi:hypothetical protein